MTADSTTPASRSALTEIAEGGRRERCHSPDVTWPTGLITHALVDGDAHRRDLEVAKASSYRCASSGASTQRQALSHSHEGGVIMAEVETLTRALGAALDARDELTEEVAQLSEQCRTLTEQLTRH